MARSKRPPRRDIYQEVTDTILGYLEEGVVPWRNPIRRAGGGGLPKNLTTGKPYRGINTFLLAMTAWAHGYASEYYLTFNQAKKLGGQVRKGEKGTLVIFWKQYVKEDAETKQEVTLPVLRHYVVFNASQVDGVEPPDGVASTAGQGAFVPIAEAEKIVQGYRDPPEIVHVFGRAAYLPRLDRIEIARPEEFESPESYYGTLNHELCHSTGVSRRLARGIGETLAPFGSPDYSNEELVAEFGSAFLCAAAGISPPTIEQSAAYIDGWRKKLRDDKKLVIQAAGQGQRAADYILGGEDIEGQDCPVGPNREP